MEELQEFDDGYVPCARCGIPVCGLSVIPQIAGDCSTMEGTQAGSVLNLAPEKTSTALGLPCEWTEEN